MTEYSKNVDEKESYKKPSERDRQDYLNRIKEISYVDLLSKTMKVTKSPKMSFCMKAA